MTAYIQVFFQYTQFSEQEAEEEGQEEEGQVNDIYNDEGVNVGNIFRLNYIRRYFNN